MMKIRIAITLLFFIKLTSCKPMIYTYVDEENTPNHLYADLLKIWTHCWEQAGWQPHILTPKDTMRHPLYSKFNGRLDELNIKHLPRHSYMRNLAMSTTKRGGFYTDVFVFPLHKVKPEDVDEMGYAKLPNNGGMTFYDGVGGSVISANLAAWDKINVFLVDNIEKNAYFSLQKLANNDLHYERRNLVVNVFGPYNNNVCDKATGKFVIRLHSVDIKVMKIKEMKPSLRNVMIANWMQFYHKLCWKNDE